MRKGAWFVIGILACCLLAAQTFDSSKRREEVKTTDIVVAVRVPVINDGSLRPDIPIEIRELRKLDIVIYDSKKPGEAHYAIVVMVIPTEHAAELTKRLAEYPSVELLTDEEVRDLRVTFSQSEFALDHLKDRVEYALTPYDEVEAFK